MYNFPQIFYIGNGHCMMKKQATQVHRPKSKHVQILNFELLPNIKNNLDWHENFTTITRLQGEHNPTNITENKNWMKEIQAPQSCSLPKHHYILDWCENFTTQTIIENTNLPKSLIEFGYWMQKLHKLELESMWGHSWFPWEKSIRIESFERGSLTLGPLTEYGNQHPLRSYQLSAQSQGWWIRFRTSYLLRKVQFFHNDKVFVRDWPLSVYVLAHKRRHRWKLQIRIL